jgi:hypothetical protein
MTFGPNSLYFHGGEMPGYNSFMGYDPVNDVHSVSLSLPIEAYIPAAVSGDQMANGPPRGRQAANMARAAIQPSPEKCKQAGVQRLEQVLRRQLRRRTLQPNSGAGRLAG